MNSMQWARIVKHLMSTERQVRKIFPQNQLDQIAQSIRSSETRHSGEIRCALESALDLRALMQGITPRERAIDVFSELRVWDTELNNGVLIYVLLADHAIEIVADRGIQAKVGTAGWEALCKNIQSAFAQGQYAAGIERCIHAIHEQLSTHFPHDGGGNNELPDHPIVIG